jgi:quinol monooxygenase YgiN
MIIVTGSVLAREGCVERLLTLSREHVRRSRRESGCISHAVHIDAENARRLVFLEEWASREALVAHFAVPASREFVQAAAELAEGAPQLSTYEASPIQMMPASRS